MKFVLRIKFTAARQSCKMTTGLMESWFLIWDDLINLRIWLNLVLKSALVLECFLQLYNILS